MVINYTDVSIHVTFTVLRLLTMFEWLFCIIYTLCVCVPCLDIFVMTKNWNATILVGTTSPLWQQNARPHEFEDVFETQNVVLVSGLLLGLG